MQCCLPNDTPIKYSRVDSRVKVSKVSNFSTTRSVPIFRVLLMIRSRSRFTSASQSVRVESPRGLLTGFKLHSVVLFGDLSGDGPGLSLIEFPAFPDFSTFLHI